MRLFEAILEANHRAVAGDKSASVAVGEFPSELPVAALTCIDARLNRLLPGVMGLPEDQFIWLRNAGNILTGPLSSTMRSLALACAVKGAREVAILGHTDCLVCRTGALPLLNRFAELGIPRAALPENLTEFFGLFASERQNVLKGAEIIRSSPLIGAKVPVHGLLLDITTGRLEWVVNGYQALESTAGKFTTALRRADQALGTLEDIGAEQGSEIKFPETKIGQAVSAAHDWLHRATEAVEHVEAALGQPASPPAAQPETVTPPPLPPRLARPTPLKFKVDFRKPRN
jgi:carbonic anhydrase